MSLVKVIPALKEFFQAYQAFLERQQNTIFSQPTFFDPTLQATNFIYIQNIKKTRERLDKMHTVLTAEPDNEKASCKVIEYAARAKDTLERIHLRATIRSNLSRTLPLEIMAEPMQTQALFHQLKAAIGEERFKQLPTPQKHWTDTHTQIKESEDIEKLAKQLSSSTLQDYSARVIQFESLRRQQLAFHKAEPTGTSAALRAKL
jgi:hypothetical protein